MQGNTSRLHELTPHAEIVSSAYQSRAVNVAAAVGLKDVLASNLGPYGTIKLLVGGAGQLKCTKDGLVLLKEMQIQHPTACMIARTATAQDDVTGDGTTSTVLLCATLLQLANNQVLETGIHPRLLVDGLEIGRDKALEYLKSISIKKPSKTVIADYEFLRSVAFTSLRTKLEQNAAEKLAGAVVSAIQCIASDTIPKNPDSNGETGDKDGNVDDLEDDDDINSKPLDMNRIEIMTLPHSTILPSEKDNADSNTMDNLHSAGGKFINGLVLDHGSRHPDMPKVLKNCKIMTCNVSLEYEKTEVQSGFVYSNAEEREKLVESERKWLDQRCQAIIEFKQKVCKDPNDSFVIINQKGIDPLSLDIFARHNILALRRAKRRNMERLTLACGGSPILSLEDLDESMLGYAGKVSEISFGDDKYTFVEDCLHPKSCTILLQAPNALLLQQMKDSIRDGLRSIKNTIEDQAVIAGAGAYEVATSMYLKNNVIPSMKGKLKVGVQVFADALLVIPKTLIMNSGFDIQETMLKLEEDYKDLMPSPNEDPATASIDANLLIGLNCKTGEPMLPSDEGVFDNVRVKRQCLYLSTVLACQLLLVDEVMRAGKQMGKNAQAQAAAADEGMMSMGM